MITEGWSDKLLRKLDDKAYRAAFVADHVRSWIAFQIRALREQKGREWSQSELGERMGSTPQSTVSRLEDPDYGKVTLATLLRVSEAYDVPLLVKYVDWEEWLRSMSDISRPAAEKESFELGSLQEARSRESVSWWKAASEKTSEKYTLLFSLRSEQIQPSLSARKSLSGTSPFLAKQEQIIQISAENQQSNSTLSKMAHQ